MYFVICFLTAFVNTFLLRNVLPVSAPIFNIFQVLSAPLTFFQNRAAPIFKNSSSSSPIAWTAFHISELEIITPHSTRIFNTLQARICQNLSVVYGFNFINTFAVNVVASLLYAVCLYRAYGALDTLSPYIYYELLLVVIVLFCLNFIS